MSKSSQGLLWSFFGVLILSPDSLLIRLLNLTDFSLIFYRSCLPAITIFLFLFWFYKKDILKVLIMIKKMLEVPVSFGFQLKKKLIQIKN